MVLGTVMLSSGKHHEQCFIIRNNEIFESSIKYDEYNDLSIWKWQW